MNTSVESDLISLVSRKCLGNSLKIQWSSISDQIRDQGWTELGRILMTKKSLKARPSFKSFAPCLSFDQISVGDAAIHWRHPVQPGWLRYREGEQPGEQPRLGRSWHVPLVGLCQDPRSGSKPERKHPLFWPGKTKLLFAFRSWDWTFPRVLTLHPTWAQYYCIWKVAAHYAANGWGLNV
jgi:hypothetical protein